MADTEINFEPTSSDSRPKTLYVGNLDQNVSEELLMRLFGQIGPCKGCKIIREPGSDPYCFLEFDEHSAAAAALMAMNKRLLEGREMKVNWATKPGSQPRSDTSQHFHIFVGDLSPDIDGQQLREAFQPFGEISDVKIIRDQHTQKSKGYGFVSFVRKQDAELAIQNLNGAWLGSRAIRVNWGTRGALSHNTPAPSNTGYRTHSYRQLNYDDVWNQASSFNHTVYCGGITQGLSESLIRQVFSEFGNIIDVKVFKDKGYSFIKFDSKEAACQAIVSMHGEEVAGFTVKCSWGKEDSGQSNYGYQGNKALQHQMASAYTGYTGFTTAASAATDAAAQQWWAGQDASNMTQEQMNAAWQQYWQQCAQYYGNQYSQYSYSYWQNYAGYGYGEGGEQDPNTQQPQPPAENGTTAEGTTGVYNPTEPNVTEQAAAADGNIDYSGTYVDPSQQATQVNYDLSAAGATAGNTNYDNFDESQQQQQQQQQQQPQQPQQVPQEQESTQDY